MQSILPSPWSWLGHGVMHTPMHPHARTLHPCHEPYPKPDVSHLMPCFQTGRLLLISVTCSYSHHCLVVSIHTLWIAWVQFPFAHPSPRESRCGSEFYSRQSLVIILGSTLTRLNLSLSLYRCGSTITLYSIHVLKPRPLEFSEDSRRMR